MTIHPLFVVFKLYTLRRWSYDDLEHMVKVSDVYLLSQLEL